MDANEIREILTARGLSFEEKEIESAIQFKYKDGVTVNAFHTGSVTVTGKKSARAHRDELRKALVDGASAGPSAPARTKGTRSVFVVYGHDTTAKTQLDAMLRRWGLAPLIMDELTSEGQTIIEKLERYTSSDIAFGVVLATPDDIGYQVGREDEQRCRARQNVILELGLLLAKLGRSKIAILIKSQENMERPSDIQGLIYLPFNDTVEETKVQLAKEMQKQGIEVGVEQL